MLKFRFPLSEDERTELMRLSQMDFSNYSEADIREEYIVPLLVMLGYRKNQDYSVSREDSFALDEAFLNVGSSRIKLDYLFSVRKQFFWLIEAKKGIGSREIEKDDIYQAYFYSQHPNIDTIYFGVCNGWYFNLYEREKFTDSAKPIISVKSCELNDKFLDIDRIIGATQILPTIKTELLRRTKKILSAEVALERLEEFKRKSDSVISEVRPYVLENFRANAKVVEEKRKTDRDNMLKVMNPNEIISDLFCISKTIGDIHRAAEMLFNTGGFKVGMSNHYLLFIKIFQDELKPVSYWHYVNATYFLVYLHKQGIEYVDYPRNGTSKTKVIDLLHDHLYNVYTMFVNKPEIKLTLLFEGLSYRMTKLFLILSVPMREKIISSVNNAQYFLPEEDVAWLGPSPAGELVRIVENTTMKSLGLFINRYYDENRRSFKMTLANDEFLQMQKIFNSLYVSSKDLYNKKMSELGSAWSDLNFYEQMFDPWNPIISAVSSILKSETQLISQFPEKLKVAMGEMAGLSVSNFTEELCIKNGITIQRLTEINRAAEIKKLTTI